MALERVIDTGLEWPRGRVKRTVTDHIQIHHTVGYYGTPERWKRLHEKKIDEGNKGVGYSYLVLADGSIYLGRGHEYAHGGVKDSLTKNEQGLGANQRSISIALDGDMREEGLPSAAQLASALELTRERMEIYGLPASAVLGHNEVPTYSGGKPTGKTYATLCPCMDMDEFRQQLQGQTSSTVVLPDDDELTEDVPAYPALYAYAGSTYVNLRAGASTGYQSIGRVNKGDEVIVLGISDGWAEVVKHEERPMLRGWCTAKYLREV